MGTYSRVYGRLPLWQWHPPSSPRRTAAPRGQHRFRIQRKYALIMWVWWHKHIVLAAFRRGSYVHHTRSISTTGPHYSSMNIIRFTYDVCIPSLLHLFIFLLYRQVTRSGLNIILPRRVGRPRPPSTVSITVSTCPLEDRGGASKHKGPLDAKVDTSFNGLMQHGYGNGEVLVLRGSRLHTHTLRANANTTLLPTVLVGSTPCPVLWVNKAATEIGCRLGEQVRKKLYT